MKKIFAPRISNAGFTLIELLIVIGVLGILAAGMLAAVDPFEQLKKGRDSNRRNIVVEYHNANIRYYATHGDLPWNVAPADACSPDFTGGPVTLGTLEDCTDMLIADGELKEDFTAAIGTDADDYYIYSPTEVQLSVCFSPESKSLFNDTATRYDDDGVDISGTGGACETKTALVPGTTCFWCAK